MINGELIVDNFAGGGGASTGIEMATGYSVDIAINHDPEAIRMHQTNHPSTKHYCESVWDVDPVQVCKGHPVALAWFSPDCKHFSKAKGGKPVEKNIRGLAWIVLKWAALVKPRVIMLENVEEFQTWGPCIPVRDKETGRVFVSMAGRHDRKKGESRFRVAEAGEVTNADKQIFMPDPKRKGQTYRKWRKQLEALGYKVQTRELVAADYGTPTMRKRFFMIARCDGKPIVWPEPTHGPADSEKVKAGLLKPYVGAYTQIDFSLPCPSIFDTAEEIKEKYGIRAVRPLAPKTMERIARGLKKFVLDNAEPFIVQVNHTGAKSDYTNSMNEPLRIITSKNGFGIVDAFMTPYIMCNNENNNGASIESPLPTITTANRNFVMAPTLIQYHSETSEKETRGQQVTEPVMTVDGSNRYGLVTSFLSKFYKSGTGQDIREPLGTVTANAGGGHFGEVRAFLIKYYGQGTGQDIKAPLDTVTAQDRFGLVTVGGVDYQIVDIGLRMLEPKELYGCQGFPDDYIIDHDYTGNSYPRSEQIKRCGNAVCPPIPAALVRVNLPELCVAQRTPNMRIAPGENGQMKFA